MKNLYMCCLPLATICLCAPGLHGQTRTIFNDGGSHTAGGGTLPPVLVLNATTVTLLHGTQINPPLTTATGDATGPAAVSVSQGSRIEIVGGQFYGGDARSTGTSSSFISTGGRGLIIVDSVGVIRNGEYVGGDAERLGSFGGTAAGEALAMGGSHVTIFDGSFRGGTNTRPGRIIQSASIRVQDGILHMFGGQTDGEIFLFYGDLVIHGSNFVHTGGLSHSQTISGVYPNGEPFTHRLNVAFPSPVIITEDAAYIGTIPEAASGVLAAIGFVALAFATRRRFR
jgi:hypothetical protein